jgi:hypothetical protein
MYGNVDADEIQTTRRDLFARQIQRGISRERAVKFVWFIFHRCIDHNVLTRLTRLCKDWNTSDTGTDARTIKAAEMFEAEIKERVPKVADVISSLTNVVKVTKRTGNNNVLIQLLGAIRRMPFVTRHNALMHAIENEEEDVMEWLGEIDMPADLLRPRRGRSQAMRLKQHCIQIICQHIKMDDHVYMQIVNRTRVLARFSCSANFGAGFAALIPADGYDMCV